MILQVLPDIPRWYTGLAEWSAALVYIILMPQRFAGWKKAALIVCALPLMIGLQVLAGTLPISFWIVGMAGAVLGIFVFIHGTSSLSARDSWYLTARAFVLAELIASLEWQLWVHWVPEAPSPALGTTNYFLSLLLLATCYGVGFTLTHFLERKNFPKDQWVGVDGRSLLIALTMALGTFFVSNISFAWTTTPFSGRTGRDIFYIRTLVDLAGFVALYTQQGHRRQTRNEIELAESRMLIKSQHEQYLQSKHNIEELNRMHHDMKHYVAAIRAEESADKRSRYLEQLEDVITGYESDIRTGNPALDVILISKFERCRRENITMTVTVDGTALGFMDLMRLSALFGNALDNAIEASIKVDTSEKRIINVSAYTEAGFVLIRFENYVQTPLRIVGGTPKTTKIERHRHGFGIPNMKRIVESYDGTLNVRVKDSWFTLTILIPKK